MELLFWWIFEGFFGFFLVMKQYFWLFFMNFAKKLWQNYRWKQTKEYSATQWTVSLYNSSSDVSKKNKQKKPRKGYRICFTLGPHQTVGMEKASSDCFQPQFYILSQIIM